MNKLTNKLNFRNVVIGLAILLVILIVLNSAVTRLTNKSILEILLPQSGSGQEKGIAFDENIVEGSSATPAPRPSQLAAPPDKDIIDAMPYYSEDFNVVYFYQDDKFLVYMNPSSEVTKEDIFRWFKTFRDVKDPSKLSIEFVEKQPEDGAPTYTPASQ